MMVRFVVTMETDVVMLDINVVRVVVPPSARLFFVARTQLGTQSLLEMKTSGVVGCIFVHISPCPFPSIDRAKVCEYGRGSSA
jgi:hypothetical protein